MTDDDISKTHIHVLGSYVQYMYLIYIYLYTLQCSYMYDSCVMTLNCSRLSLTFSYSYTAQCFVVHFMMPLANSCLVVTYYFEINY